MKIEREEEKKKAIISNIHTERVVAVYVKNDVKNIVNTHLHTVEMYFYLCVILYGSIHLILILQNKHIFT